MKRGEIYYVNMDNSTGHEMKKDRPCIVLGMNPIYHKSTVTVVLCSASYRPDSPTHITVRSTPKISTAMCEHICTVDYSRVRDKFGELTPQELQAVEMGVASALGLNMYIKEAPNE